MTVDAPSLPVIDITPYLSDSGNKEERAAVAKALNQACRDVGFFYLRITSFLSDDELKEVLALGHEFFQRPHEEKLKIRLEVGDGIRGYQPMLQNANYGLPDHQEGLDFYAPSPYPPGEKRPLAGENQWPENPAKLRPALEQWTEKMKILGKAVMRGMADGLGMSEEEWRDLWALCENSFWSMRVIGESLIRGPV